jgi:type I site-specific restriction endonuclease
LIDQIINRLISKKEKSDRLKTLVFAQNSSSAQKVFALLGDRYDCVWHHFDDHRGLVYDQYHLVIALGSCDNNTLQTISDAVR